jgi:hypothetical protein
MSQESSMPVIRPRTVRPIIPVDRRREVLARHRPKSPDASLERLRRLAGIIRLEGEGPIPSGKFLGCGSRKARLTSSGRSAADAGAPVFGPDG